MTLQLAANMFRNQDEQDPQGADKKNESVTVRVLQDQSNRVTSQVQKSQHVCGRWLIAMITLVDTCMLLSTSLATAQLDSMDKD